MDATYTLTDARNNLGKVVNEVRHGGRTVEITDHGTPVAAVIPIELLDYFQSLEDARDLAAAEESKAQTTRRVPHAEVAARFGLNPDGTAKR
ncbi:type II toxin-antitoxin system Phd/YefM family antitoxin [Streptomyces xinghaiensis]|uniref:type II toxin-antitoxin system Phd/YefM family antitoxin n=1 Tax=Streptomyces xinghaiensis TaxID=1038928 RepID=UPI000309E940|nr:type II toxin-antitoxin system Phd/YefM family antitoxin [Streptomyces xinghaiensis]MZE79703.1 type II toxin-antitoxin system prevent-host-death family antitoxin [Streptomyces sp. SID5475]